MLPSCHPSVTSRYCIKTTKRIELVFSTVASLQPSCTVLWGNLVYLQQLDAMQSLTSPLGYPPRLLLINWSVNWFVCVQCSTCTRTQPCGLNTPRKSSVYWCGQQNPSTVDLLCYTYDGRVRHRWMHKVSKFITHWSLWRKKCVDWTENLVTMATSVGQSQPNFTAIIYARRDTNPENWAKIEHVHFEVIGLDGVVTRRSAIAEGPRDAPWQLKPC